MHDNENATEPRDITEDVEFVMAQCARDFVMLEFLAKQNEIHADAILRELRERATKEALKARRSGHRVRSSPTLTFRPAHVPESIGALADLLEDHDGLNRDGNHYWPVKPEYTYQVNQRGYDRRLGTHVV